MTGPTLYSGWPPEEGLGAVGLQTLEVYGQALALLHPLRSEVLITANSGSSELTGCLECCMFGRNRCQLYQHSPQGLELTLGWS